MATHENVLPYNSATTNSLYSCSFIFSRRFILIKVIVDPEPIPGTLRQEYTLNRTPVITGHHAPTRSHTHSLLGQFTVANLPIEMFSRGGRKPMNQ